MSTPRVWLKHLFSGAVVSTARFARAEALESRGAHATAFPLFVKAARAGLREAQYRLGRSYLLGLGVPPSLGEALRWLRHAAEAGDTKAQTKLAALALQGVSDRGAAGLFNDHNPFDDHKQNVDFDRAAYWCRKAVAGGSAEAKALLGFILTAGPEHHRDAPMAETLYREAAEAGWPRGKLGLAMTLLQKGDQENAAQSVDLLRSAADEGIAVALYLLGMMAESGAAGPIDFDAAADSYKRGAELGHPPAQVRYGFALLLGRGTERDVFKAETWLRRAALLGDTQAAAVVGYLYANEGDIPPNYAESAMWLRRAAEAKHAGAARTLGRMLMLGAGVPKDFQEAVHWLRIARDHGDEMAHRDMVRLAQTRQVGEDDQRVAVDWLRDEAATGNPTAQFDLGLCLAEGIGAKQNNLAAYSWVLKAAKGGHSQADQILAQLRIPRQTARPCETPR